MKTDFPCVVTIAGTDPSGGAGIQADIKTISATGSYAASVITALVAQNTQGVQGIQTITPEFVKLQMDSVFSDLTCQAIKIGMLHSKKIINIIAVTLAELQIKHVVLDPVMVAKSGCELLKSNTIGFLKKKLLPQASLITPNLCEAEILLGKKIDSLAAMAAAAQEMSLQFNTNVLLKGGHLEGERCSDVLYTKNDSTPYWFHGERISTRNTHGTGCSLSSAIASYLAQNYSLHEAVAAGKQYLSQAIESGSQLKIGKGCGPVDHFYFLENRRIK